jgi:hypothetical protein
VGLSKRTRSLHASNNPPAGASRADGGGRVDVATPAAKLGASRRCCSKGRDTIQSPLCGFGSKNYAAAASSRG